jgi:hypothetical protein
MYTSFLEDVGVMKMQQINEIPPVDEAPQTNEAPQINELFTVSETARYLRVDPSTFRRWVRRGTVKGVLELPGSVPNRPKLRVPKCVLASMLGVDESQLPVLQQIH